MDSKSFNSYFPEEINTYKELGGLYLKLFNQINNKVFDYPQDTIRLLLGYNALLISRSFWELKEGYVGVSMLILRSALENLVHSMYFLEYPETEKEIRERHENNFINIRDLRPKKYRNGWQVEGELKRIDEEGTIFPKNGWYQKIYKNIIEELNFFVHTNPDYIYTTIYQQNGEDITLQLGPNYKEERFIKNAFQKIIEVQEYTIGILDKTFKEDIQDNSPQILKAAIKKTNKWKLDYHKK